jgi:hypothetical protein
MTLDLGALNELLSQCPYEYLGFQIAQGDVAEPKAVALFEPHLTDDILAPTMMRWYEVMKLAPFLREVNNAMVNLSEPGGPFGCSQVLYGHGAARLAPNEPPWPGVKLTIGNYWLTLGAVPGSALTATTLGRLIRLVETRPHNFTLAFTFVAVPPRPVD